MMDTNGSKLSRSNNKGGTEVFDIIFGVTERIMKKIVGDKNMTTRILLTCCLIMALFASTMPVQAEPEVADRFQSPLAVYKVTGYRFGEHEGGGIYHAGEDLKAAFPEPVRATANGVVVQSKEFSDGYGNVVVIEHTLPDNSKICSIYGHLSRQPGYKMISTTNSDGTPRVVGKGEIIGYIGTDAENGKGGEHLHFGIKKGAYDKTYKGEVSLAELAGFCKPSDYLYLIRAVGTDEVYRLSNIGDKIWIRTADDFNACGWRWDDIRPVTTPELNSHTTVSGDVNFPSGTLIKMANSPEISKVIQYSDGSGTIKNRMRQHFTSWTAYTSAGGNSDLSNVKIVSPTGYYLYAQGDSVPEVPDLGYVSVSEGACMKASGDDEISAIIDGKRHPFSTWDAFMKYCEIYRPRSDLDVVTVSPDHYTSIPEADFCIVGPEGDILTGGGRGGAVLPVIVPLETVFPDGTFIRTPVYDCLAVIRDGQRCEFKNVEAFLENGGLRDLSNVEVLTEGEFDSLPAGEIIYESYPTDGTFIRTEVYNEVSVMKNGKRCPFATENAYLQAGVKFDLSNVRLVSEEMYDTLPAGTTIETTTESSASNDVFIRTPVYDCLAVIRDGQRCEFKNVEAFLENGGLRDLSNVEVLTEGEFDSLPAGEMIYESYPIDGTFIRTEVYNEVSVMKNGKRCPFATENAYLQAGVKSDLSNVRLVSEEMYDTLPAGTTIYL